MENDTDWYSGDTFALLPPLSSIIISYEVSTEKEPKDIGHKVSFRLIVKLHRFTDI